MINIDDEEINYKWLRQNRDTEKGGVGSGNFGHAGRQGKRGGSAKRRTYGPWNNQKRSGTELLDDFRREVTGVYHRRKALMIENEILYKEVNELTNSWLGKKELAKQANLRGDLEAAKIYLQDAEVIDVSLVRQADKRKVYRQRLSETIGQEKGFFLKTCGLGESNYLHVDVDRFVGGQDMTNNSITKALDFLGSLLPIPQQRTMGTIHVRIESASSLQREMCNETAVFLNNRSSESTAVHEMAHWMEQNNPLIREAAQAFLKKRTEGEEPIKLSEVTGSQAYRSDEVTKKDKFASPYMGKLYEDGSTELLSMGLQYMFEQPGVFSREDPEMFAWLLDTIRIKMPKVGIQQVEGL